MNIFNWKLSFQFVILLCLTIFSTLEAQQPDKEKLKALKARSIGPAGMSGRVTSIDVINEQPHIIYVGTASGGIWKSTSGGIDWEPLFDKEKTLSIGAIAIQQSNPSVIWAGTGEGNPRNSLNGGMGIYKSFDGGKNWKLMGLEKTRNIHRIIIDKQNPNTVYVGAIGSPWGEHPERGVYKTTDGGNTWDKILFVNNKTGCADLVVDPTNPNKLIAAMWEHRRKPWTFNSGGEGSGLYISFDGGENWEQRTSEEGLPEGELGRIGLAIAPSQPNRIYALIEAKKNGLYRSDDGGFKWKKISEKEEIGNRPFYYSDIFVDPKNENRVYSLFSFVNMSEDGGKNFTTLLPYSGVHPDHHAWWIHPDNPNYMIDGNDGGLNITHDRGKTWRFIENLPLAQFYHINADMDIPYNIYGGMQDNGSWAGPAYVWKSQGIRNAYWQEVLFGDGFDVLPDPVNSRYGYAMAQRGYVSRYDRETGHSKIIRPTHPNPEVRLRFNWNAAIAQDPYDVNTIYFGSQFVHKSTDKGHTWEIISPDLTTNDPDKQLQHESGGLTIDATGAENFTTILVIEPSKLENGVIWAGTDDGNLQLTKDGGKTWTNVIQNINGVPKGSWIPQIKASSYNAAEAVVLFNNYRNNDFRPFAFRTKDYGATWQSLIKESDVTGYTLSFVQDPVVPSLLFLGTDGGLFISFDDGKNWMHWDNDYPHVSTMDMVIHPREHDLVIGTFGRAAYILDDLRPLRAIASSGSGIVNDSIRLVNPPDAYLTLNQQPVGTRFGADAMYNGENRSRGAMISFFANKPEKKKTEKAKNENENENDNEQDKIKLAVPDSLSKNQHKDSVYFSIYNAENKKIRSMKYFIEKNGLQRTTWDLREIGNKPLTRTPSTSNDEPAGIRVLPGQYKIVANYKTHKDSTTITVHMDPRVGVSNETLSLKHQHLTTLTNQVKVAYNALEQLKGSIKIIESIQSQLKSQSKKENDTLITYGNSIKDSLNVLIDKIIGKEIKKQGIVRSPDPSTMSYFNNAFYYLSSTLQPPGSTEERLMTQAYDKLEEALTSINLFYEQQWPAYQDQIDKVSLSPFKENIPFELD